MTPWKLHLNCMRSRWYRVLQWPRSSWVGTTQQRNIEVTRTNKIHGPGISLQLSPTHRHHQPPPKVNYLPVLQKCFHASRGTYTCSLDSLKFCFWGEQACPTLVHGPRNCLLPCQLFPSYHSTICFSISQSLQIWTVPSTVASVLHHHTFPNTITQPTEQSGTLPIFTVE